MSTVFVRLLEAEDKGADLEAALASWRADGVNELVFEPDAETFRQVPGAPFAYWVSDRIRALFEELPAFEGEGRTAKVGLQTSDDFRFVRAWWEVEAGTLGEKWFPFAKGGKYSPFYADVHLVVNWNNDGREIREFVDPKSGRQLSRPQNVDYFFRPGLTWPLRGISFSAQAVPRGSVFSVAGKMAFDDDESALAGHLGAFNTRAFDYLVRSFAGKVGGVQYEAGLIQRIPVPEGGSQALAPNAEEGWKVQRAWDAAVQVSHVFELPALVARHGRKLSDRAAAQEVFLGDAGLSLAQVRTSIDDLAFELYGISDEDRQQIEQGFGGGGLEDTDSDGDDEGDETEDEGVDLPALCSSLLEWCVGVAFGRFDLRLATGEREPPPEPEPFDPLPPASPGMLQDASGLPAQSAPSGYPLPIPDDGILVDDLGHPSDLARRVEQVFDVLDAERGHGWLEEACEAVGSDLRSWLAKSCFDGHLKRYSKSRRKAPVFWQLGTKSRSYSVWLYYPRLTQDTLYRVLNDYVTPKLRHEEQKLTELTQATGGSPRAGQRKELAAQEALVDELRAFRAEVERVAPLWKPAMEDGVILNVAPLWRLLEATRSWQKEAKKKWVELVDGKYDWAQWAMHLWPDRVVRKCATDRSMAIAHRLEAALWEEDADAKWSAKALSEADLQRLIDGRSSLAVQSALHSLLNA